MKKPRPKSRFPTPDDYPDKGKAPSRYGGPPGIGMHCSTGTVIRALGYEFDLLIVPYSTAIVRVVWVPPPDSGETTVSSVDVRTVGRVFHRNGSWSDQFDMKDFGLSVPVTQTKAKSLVLDWLELPGVQNCFTQSIDVIKNKTTYGWCYYARIAPLNKEIHLLAKRKYRNSASLVYRGCEVDVRGRPTMEFECSLAKEPHKVWYFYDYCDSADTFMKAIHKFFGNKKRDKYLVRQFQTGIKSFWRRFISKYFRLEDE